MKSESKCLLIALSLGFGLTLALLWLLGGGLSVRATPTAELHVCPSGCAHSSIQAAVDAATPGDVIKVAADTYTDTHSRAGVTQVVYISKSVTICGGYTTSDWTSPDPEANPTTLDARGLGRMVVISGTITPTVKGLRITGGDASGLGGGWGGYDAGGGVYLHEAAATVIGCVVYSNTASQASVGLGGGVFLAYSDATLIGNTVQSNTASTADWSRGGGLHLYRSDALLSYNTVVGNTSSKAGGGYGGGLDITASAATLSGNTVQGNIAGTVDWGRGGGLYLSYSDNATLNSNTVQTNTASTASGGYGGGLDLYRSDVTLNGNLVQGNVASHITSGSAMTRPEFVAPNPWG